MLPERESRPVGNGPAQSISTAIKSKASLSLPVEDRADLDTLTDHETHLASIRERSPKAIGGCHAVLVFQPDGRYQRRLYLSLHAADAAMQRAADRGLTASCVLVELVPVPSMPVIVVGGGDR